MATARTQAHERCRVLEQSQGHHHRDRQQCLGVAARCFFRGSCANACEGPPPHEPLPLLLPVTVTLSVTLTLTLTKEAVSRSGDEEEEQNLTLMLSLALTLNYP